jgi:outer membrane cobalamin receptor
LEKSHPVRRKENEKEKEKEKVAGYRREGRMTGELKVPLMDDWQGFTQFLPISEKVQFDGMSPSLMAHRKEGKSAFHVEKGVFSF